jgi:hypothetical protein
LKSYFYVDYFTLDVPPQAIDLADFGGVNIVLYDLGSGVFKGVVDPRRGV